MGAYDSPTLAFFIGTETSCKENFQTGFVGIFFLARYSCAALMENKTYNYLR